MIIERHHLRFLVLINEAREDGLVRDDDGTEYVCVTHYNTPRVDHYIATDWDVERFQEEV